MSIGEKKDLEFDIRGQICPSALLIALRQANVNRERLRRGEACLVFRTDNRTAAGTIPQALQNMGYRVRVRREGAAYVIDVEGAAVGAEDRGDEGRV